MILPKKQDLDKAKNDERKKLIDEGIVLATKVDKLRETSANEEKRLNDWRENTLKLIQVDISKLNEEKETVKHNIEEARLERDKLLKPLTKEWEELKIAKGDLGKEKQTIWEEKEFIKAEKQEINDEKIKITQIVSRITKNEEETNKAKDEAISLKGMAQKEYEMAHDEHISQTDTHEKAISKVSQTQKEYEVALSLIKIRENEVKEKESDLLVREKHLASQQVALRIAYEEIKKNDSRTTNN